MREISVPIGIDVDARSSLSNLECLQEYEADGPCYNR